VKVGFRDLRVSSIKRNPKIT